MGVDGTFSSKGNFRACPIQLFFKNKLSLWEQRFIAYWFNYNLEKLRAEWNSVFLNTYRHTSSYYTRKIIGLNKIRALISTCPLLDLDREERKRVLELLKQSKIEGLNKWIEGYLSHKKRFFLLFDKQRKKR